MQFQTEHPDKKKGYSDATFFNITTYRCEPQLKQLKDESTFLRCGITA